MKAPWKFSKRNAVQNAPKRELNSDPWHGCRTKVECQDKARCDAWNDDISNLITFVSPFWSPFLQQLNRRCRLDWFILCRGYRLLDRVL